MTNGWTKSITEEDTSESLFLYLKEYENRYLWISMMSGEEYLLDFSDENPVIFDVSTGEEISTIRLKRDLFSNSIHWWDTARVAGVFLREKKYPEIKSSDGKLSVYIDEFNINCWMDEAEKIRSVYNDNLVPGLKITGCEYHQKIKQLVDIAYSIVAGSVIPDIFSVIPLKKNRTFQAARTIPVFSNGIGHADNYIGSSGGVFNNEYIEGTKLQLCIFAEDNHPGFEPQDFNQLEKCSATRAKLVIRAKSLNSGKNLLNADMTVNDIVTKAKNIKDEDVMAGRVYEEKSGTQYFYLGKLDENCEKVELGEHVYIRYAKKIQTLIKQAKDAGVKSIDDFNQNYIKPAMCSLSFSQRENPRKFVNEVEKIFE